MHACLAASVDWSSVAPAAYRKQSKNLKENVKIIIIIIISFLPVNVTPPIYVPRNNAVLIMVAAGSVSKVG